MGRLILLYLFLASAPSFAGESQIDLGPVNSEVPLIKSPWRALGPFEWAKEGRHFWGDRQLPPDGKLDLNAAYPGANETLRWREIPEWDTDGRIHEIAAQVNLNSVTCSRAVYLHREITSATDAKAILYLGFDDGLVLSLNGERIYQRFYYASTQPRAEAVPIQLKKGPNEFVLKLLDKDNTSPPSFCFDIVQDTDPLQRIRTLEQIIADSPHDATRVLQAKKRLVSAYRQAGELKKADSMAGQVIADALSSREEMEAINEYRRTRPAGMGEVLDATQSNGKALLRTANGTLHVSFWVDTAPRITFAPAKESLPYPPDRRPLPVAWDIASKGRIEHIETKDDRFILHGRALAIEVLRSGGAIVIVHGGKRRMIEMGVTDIPNRGRFAEAVFHLGAREGVFGTGQRYDSFNRRGRHNELHNADRAYGDTHFTLPYFTCQGGDALYLNSFGDGEIDIDRPSAENMAVCRVEEGVLDLFYFAGTPKELVRQWVDLTGHTVMPPDWTLGVWMSRLAYPNQAETLAIARKLREKKVPASVLVLEGWYGPGDRWMEWDSTNWPDPEGLCRTLHELGFKVVLWTHQYTPTSPDNPTPMQKEAFDNKYFLTWDGKPWNWGGNDYPVDFFRPGACDWWTRLHRPLFNPITGVDAMKTDIGENCAGVASDSWYGINNLYALGYIRCNWEMAKTLTGEGVVWARTGTVGTQQYPILWAGDHSTWFQGLQEALNAMLSTGLEGYAWTSFDVGGLYGDLDKETYIRMAQVGAFCPIMQAHGQGPREPWEFGDDAVAIFNQYANLHLALKPYRIAAGKEAVATGVPIMRPLWMEHPDDPKCYDAEFQYYFGPDILVAPIMSYDHTRTVYLPRGEWLDAWTGKPITGPATLNITAPLDKIPVYVRKDAAVLDVLREHLHNSQ